METKNSKSFFKKLDRLGYSTLEEYLNTDYFSELCQRYKDAGFPIECLGCDIDETKLRHRSFNRLGRESFGDLLPFCDRCFKMIEDYRKTHKTELAQIHKICRLVFNWSKEKTHRKFEPFNNPESKSMEWKKAWVNNKF